MNKIDMEYIKKYLDNNNNIIGNGKEVIVYGYYDLVIKIFKDKRLSPYERISDEGLEKLSELSLNHFNKPIDIITNNDMIIGYTEKKLNINDNKIDLSQDTLDSLKEDIIKLSYNGFKIEDIFYNYTLDPDLIFYDLTSYKYVNTEKKELCDFYYKKNIATINTFLVGLTLFGAYRHSQTYEFTKTYKANEYINNNLKDEYYGDYLKNTKKL